MASITVRDLAVGFEPAVPGAPPVLADLDIAIDDGSFVCVLGPSGCGKSTLLNVVGGLVPATAGTVLVGGQEVDGPGPDRGMVFQGYSLFGWLTVRGNVEFGVPRQSR